MAAIPEANETAAPPSRSPISSSKASQPGVPSSRAYSRPADPPGSGAEVRRGDDGHVERPAGQVGTATEHGEAGLHPQLLHEMHYSALMSADQMPGTARSVNRVVGERVRGHRSERGWTLDDLAGRSGVSRRMVVNIEQGVGNPSIATLLRISDALGVGLPVLVDVERRRDVAVTAAGRRTGAVARTARRAAASLVAGTAPPDVVELWDWHLHPGEAHRSDPHSAGTRELLLVLEGEVDLLVGEVVERLGTGSSATFAGDAVHGYAAVDGATAPARFALTVFQPHVGGAAR